MRSCVPLLLFGLATAWGCTANPVPDAGYPAPTPDAGPPIQDSGPADDFDAGPLPTGPFTPTITMATANETCPTCSDTDPTCKKACGGQQQYVYDFTVTVDNSGVAGNIELFVSSPDSSMNPVLTTNPEAIGAGQTVPIGPLEVVVCNRMMTFSVDEQVYIGPTNLMDLGSTPLTYVPDDQCNMQP